MSFHKLPKDDTQHQNHLDGAIKLLGLDLQEESEKAGLDNHLQRWIEDLKDANNPELHQLVIDLQELKAHFNSGGFDKDVVGTLLARLGENTTKAAIFSENPNTAERITKLGETLTATAAQVK
ncbi:hypothetical protein FY528_16940 [Hymenobacter lutimineralis]|uniref:Uncharacterized protein n=1 Tax=Hymenobacter lutimineralis TaxID=2606448 RepID=A0A5D6UV30_9BACT|nr:hypothetical protein [Hymenobacter lutimineralis]TYZ06748.1 hypothetical protein FY528_16940 [Hymenobacter lutimineralis]